MYNRYNYYQSKSQGSNQQEQGWYAEQQYNFDQYQIPNQQYNNDYRNYNNNNYQLQATQSTQAYYHQPVAYQGYHQKIQQNKWNNKRSHDYVDNPYSNQTVSPEPKRQFQKQKSYETPIKKNQFSNNTHQAAYETANSKNHLSTQMQQKNFRKSAKPNKTNQFTTIQEQKQKEWTEMFAQTLSFLNGCKAGEEVNILLTYLQPSRASWVKIKEEIYNDLLKVMSPMGVEKVLVFGSTLTGLDFHGSDLDYYIQLKNPPSQEDEIKKILSRAAKLIYCLQGRDFQIICTIHGARVPIIRLVHVNSKIVCDVNFSSKFGYYNSYFIGHILGYDKRIKELAVILKLWSKSYKLAPQMIMSNYCLMMCMIFYLQNLETPMLDTILNNQRSRSPMILDMKYKWNFYFNDNFNKTENNHDTLRELLVGFFEFYDKINYSEYIVSLFVGGLIKRTDFDLHPDLEECRQIVVTQNLQPLKIETNQQSFIIQDGFELNLNIGIKVKKHVDVFFELIKLSHKKCLELKDQPFSELLIKLFTDLKLSNGESSKPKNKKKFCMTVHAIAGDLKICQDILSSTNANKVYSVMDQQSFLYAHILEYTKKFLQDIYLCSIVPDISDSSSSSSSMHSRFKIILPFDTINGRKKIGFKDDDSVQQEINLSTKMLAKKLRLDLDIIMVVSSKDKGKTIDFDMFDNNNASKKSALLTFGNYFSINITTAIKFYLKKRLETVMKTL